MIKNKVYNIGNINKKIALFADIHFTYNYDENIFRQIIDNLELNKPDFICIPGDIVDDASILKDKDYISNLTNFIRSLSLIAPVIISKGNHDETDFSTKKHSKYINEDWFLSLNTIENVYYLNNKTLIREDISFSGLNLDYEFYADKNHEFCGRFAREIDTKIKIIDKMKYNILLCHTPSCILNNYVLENSKNIKNFDLVLAGHMHNGLVFNFLDKEGNIGFISPYRKLFPKYAKGLSNKNINNKKINLIVTGGIVKFSKVSPRFFHKFNILYPINIDYINI